LAQEAGHEPRYDAKRTIVYCVISLSAFRHGKGSDSDGVIGDGLCFRGSGIGTESDTLVC